MNNNDSRNLILQAFLGQSKGPKRLSPNPGKILAFSMNGEHEQLDSSTSRWSSWMQKPCIEGFGIAIVKDNIFLIGITEDENNYDTEIYNVRLNAFKRGPRLKKER